MELINKTLKKNYFTAKLFLEELEAIEVVLNKSAEKFEIKTENYKFSTVEEFRNKFDNQKLNNVEITAWNPYISIEFRKSWVKLYCGSDNTESAGVFYKLDSIISKTSRKPNFFYSYYTFLFGNVLLYLVPSLIGKYINEYIFGGLGVVLIIWIFWVSYVRMFNSGEIVVAKKGNFKNFFSRNRDQIIVGVLIALVTIIATTYLPALQTVTRSFIETH